MAWDGRARACEQLRVLVAHLGAHPALVMVSVDPVSVLADGLCLVHAGYGLACARAWVRSLGAETVTVQLVSRWREMSDRARAVLTVERAPLRVEVMFGQDDTWALAVGLGLRFGDARGATVSEVSACLGAVQRLVADRGLPGDVGGRLGGAVGV